MMNRLINVTIDKDNNLVVTIRKYGWLTCMIHSFWGIVVLLCMAGLITQIVEKQWWAVVGILVVASFAWVKAWLNSNDKLKGSIYISLLKDFMGKTITEDELPVIMRFNSYSHVIETMTKDGDMKVYSVERMIENLPLYAVKIHTKPIKDGCE